MKIVVDEMPKSVKECLFSMPKKLSNGDIIYGCSLHEYIEDYKTDVSLHKPVCLCKDVNLCNRLKEREKRG